jgi:hypothetical protein
VQRKPSVSYGAYSLVRVLIISRGNGYCFLDVPEASGFKDLPTMRFHLKGLLAIVASIVASSLSAAAERPLVPIVSSLHHWNHHWYIWLPGDPVYEAVEVMMTERGPQTPPLVWVFFTEREGPKHQVHYVNDAQIARAMGIQSRDITFVITGSEGGPRGASVELVDFKGRPVAIDVQFAPDARLVTTGAGLTNQMGHSVDRLLLVFFREKNAFAQTWRVAIAGLDVAKPQPGQSHPVPFPAAYSSNIFVGGFPFGNQRISFDAAGSGEEQEVERFTQGTTPGTYLAVRPDGTSVELDAALEGGLRYYRHHDGAHVLEISFDLPLPSAGRLLTAEGDSAYRMSLDDFRDLLAGTVHAARHGDMIVLDWRYEAPDWARTHPLRTTTLLRDGSVARVELQPVHAGP